MSRNEGPLDRSIRGAAAVVLVVVAVILGATSIPGIVLLAVAAVLAVTAAVGMCPLYRVLGMTTLRQQAAAAPTTQPTGR